MEVAVQTATPILWKPACLPTAGFFFWGAQRAPGTRGKSLAECFDKLSMNGCWFSRAPSTQLPVWLRL